MRNLWMLCLVLLGLSFQNLSAQTDPKGLPEFNMVVVKGKVFQRNLKVNETAIDIIRDGDWAGVEVTKHFGRFNVALSTGHQYTLRFKQYGKVTQEVCIDTRLDEGRNGYWETKFNIELVDSDESLDLSIFDKPIFAYSYNTKIDDFTCSKEETEQLTAFYKRNFGEMPKKKFKLSFL